jgi:hypothetical protein
MSDNNNLPKPPLPPQSQLFTSADTIKNMEVPIIHDKLYLCKQFNPAHCQELHNAAEVASCLNHWNKLCDQQVRELIQKAT